MSDNDLEVFKKSIGYLQQLRSIPLDIIVYYLNAEHNFTIKSKKSGQDSETEQNQSIKLSDYKEGYFEEGDYQNKRWKFPKYYITIENKEEFIFLDGRSGAKDQKANKQNTAKDMELLFDRLKELSLIEEVIPKQNDE